MRHARNRLLSGVDLWIGRRHIRLHVEHISAYLGDQTHWLNCLSSLMGAIKWMNILIFLASML